MITAEINGAIVLDTASFSFMGKSTDEKPISKYNDLFIKNGSSFMEMDTLKVKFYDADAVKWLPEEEV